MHAASRSVIALLLLAVPGTALAQLPFACPSQRGVSICPELNPENGHYYERISAGRGISWAEALEITHRGFFHGVVGHLATITSMEEEDFLTRKGINAGWIGASDRDTEGDWRWVDGPEAGTRFWNGGPGGTALGFESWTAGEPNNAGLGEDYAIASDSGWNDLPGDFTQSIYLIEFSVPEPSSYGLAIIGLLGLGGVAGLRRCRNSTSSQAG